VDAELAGTVGGVLLAHPAASATAAAKTIIRVLTTIRKLTATQRRAAPPCLDPEPSRQVDQ